jgi:Spy/CpxP family protein refolding chaperone
MKTIFAAITVACFLIATLSGVNAQEQQKSQPMPMMKQMMGGQGGGMNQMQGGMRCPMCGQMVSEEMMGQMPMMKNMMDMMSGQGGGMNQAPMMGGMMSQMMEQMRHPNLPDVQMLLGLSDQLKLTDEQVRSLKQVHLQLQKDVIRKQADLAIASLELNALLDQEKIDMGQVRQKAQAAANLEAEIKLAHIQADTDARAVLTPEQRAMLAKMSKMEKPMMMGQSKASGGESPQPSGHEQHH